jgi:hypothetical protein
MARIEIYSPIARTRITTHPLAARPDSLSGLRIGWCDNLKANAGSLLECTAEQFAAGGLQFESFHGTKNATAAAPPELLVHLQTCDAVVLAIAD